MKEPITIDKPSHLCVSADCRYGKTTMLPGYFVSSVGEYVPEGGPLKIRHGKKTWEEIGLGRMYETYVFEWGGQFCSCGCGVPVPKYGYLECEGLPANTREECEKNHALLVEKYRTFEGKPDVGRE